MRHRKNMTPDEMKEAEKSLEYFKDFIAEKTAKRAISNNDRLLEKLQKANVCCRECGLKYGRYVVGCSSIWEGVCDVCGEKKPVTEVRDYNYLSKTREEETGGFGCF